MKGKSRGLRARGRLKRALSALVLLITGVAGVSVLGTNAASATASVHAIVDGTPEAWSPHVADGASVLNNGDNLTIACYMTGDSVSGPYGSENVWDYVSGGSANNVWPGMFVPDADIWTGSNSPVVPPCPASWVTGRALENPTYVYNGPSAGNSVIEALAVNMHVVIKCYITNPSSWVGGPYGSEDIWDQITPTDGPVDWVPDAQIYTGSNSAVVPVC